MLPNDIKNIETVVNVSMRKIIWGVLAVSVAIVGSIVALMMYSSNTQTEENEKSSALDTSYSGESKCDKLKSSYDIVSNNWNVSYECPISDIIPDYNPLYEESECGCVVWHECERGEFTYEGTYANGDPAILTCDVSTYPNSPIRDKVHSSEYVPSAKQQQEQESNAREKPETVETVPDTSGEEQGVKESETTEKSENVETVSETSDSYSNRNNLPEYKFEPRIDFDQKVPPNWPSIAPTYETGPVYFISSFSANLLDGRFGNGGIMYTTDSSEEEVVAYFQKFFDEHSWCKVWVAPEGSARYQIHQIPTSDGTLSAKVWITPYGSVGYPDTYYVWVEIDLYVSPGWPAYTDVEDNDRNKAGCQF